jgi:hypothetical protein
VFDDLDRTLEKLLTTELPFSELVISFAAPDEALPNGGKKPVLNLFLYSIQENRELRRDDSAGRPVRVDCHYIASVISRSTENPEEDEHRILGAVMRVFLRHREIPAAIAQGVLRDQPLPMRATTLLPTTQESGAELWQAFRVKPRPSLRYAVTISVDALASAGPEAPVTAFRADATAPAGFGGIGATVRPSLYGTVTDALSGQPLSGARIELTGYPDAFRARLEAGGRGGRPGLARSSATGGFRFFDLPPGTYAVAVSLPGAGLRYGAVALAGLVVGRDAGGNPVAAVADAALPPSAVVGQVSRAPDDTDGELDLVEVRVAGSGESTFTDAAGRFTLAAIEPGARQLHFARQGLASKTVPVTVEQGRSTTLNVQLDR